MVVEPDVLVRTSVAEYLRGCGYKVIEGVTAADVWIVVGSDIAVDMLFAQVNLSGHTDRFALARRLRQTRPHIAVILNSGVAAAAEESEALCEQGPRAQRHPSTDSASQIRQLLERRRAAGLKP